MTECGVYVNSLAAHGSITEEVVALESIQNSAFLIPGRTPEELRELLPICNLWRPSISKAMKVHDTLNTYFKPLEHVNLYVCFPLLIAVPNLDIIVGFARLSTDNSCRCLMTQLRTRIAQRKIGVRSSLVTQSTITYWKLPRFPVISDDFGQRSQTSLQTSQAALQTDQPLQCPCCFVGRCAAPLAERRLSPRRHWRAWLA